MGNVNVKLPPGIEKRLEEESDGAGARFDSKSEALRYYLTLGIERDNQLDEVKEDRDAWREMALSLKED